MSMLHLDYQVPGDDFTRAGEASGDVKHKLKKLGYEPDAIRRVSIAMYEGEINMVIHAGGGEAVVILEEIAQLVSGTDGVEQEINRRELIRIIDDFLASLPAHKRKIFVCRYWYFDQVSEIAAQAGMTENHVSVTLSRLRGQLRRYLTERGFDL